jgi:type I restriction enzyme, S subunit
MKWDKVILRDYTTKIGSGVTPRGGANVYQESGVSLFRSQNIYNGSFFNQGLAFISEVIAAKMKSVEVVEGDVLLNITGDSVARCCSAPLGLLPGRVNQHVAIVRVDKEKLDSKFLMYQLISPFMQSTMLSYAEGAGATRNALTKGIIEDLKINLPPLPTQRKIASILSAYDDLIENNLKRIKLLEEKARIEFNSIQKNKKLDLKKAAEVLQFTTGKLNSNAAVANGLYPFFTCGEEILRTNTFLFDEEVVLLGGNNASAIYPVFYYKGKFDAYQRTYIIKPRSEINISFKYLYFFWEGKLNYLKNISTGAATKFLTLKILNDIDVPIPDKKVMEDYERLTKPIFKLKAILMEQNTKLREARDILLPRLMSGEVEV